MGIRTVMITGDNRLTAAAIAAESGVSDFIAEAKPESKLEAIRAEQREGHLVGMIGDGTNDAPALAQADVGVAMASGTQTAREAGNMIDFDNDPAKVIDVVEVGKQLLITRGSLTTFSIANDVAKYFAILPAVFSGFYAERTRPLASPLGALNIMRLATPESAILSAVIFNALIIIALIPLALRGVKFNPKAGASRILRRNLLIYGLGGIIAPFIGIKLLDLLLGALGLGLIRRKYERTRQDTEIDNLPFRDDDPHRSALPRGGDARGAAGLPGQGERQPPRHQGRGQGIEAPRAKVPVSALFQARPSASATMLTSERAPPTWAP